jgi:hypothetical protein
MGGDAITLIERSLDTDYRGALSWLGLRPGEIPRPDPAMIRRQKARQGLQRWARQTARWMRDQYYIRGVVEVAATALLDADPTDEAALNALARSIHGRERLGYLLDMLNGSESDQLEAWRFITAGTDKRRAA